MLTLALIIIFIFNINEMNMSDMNVCESLIVMNQQSWRIPTFSQLYRAFLWSFSSSFWFSDLYCFDSLTQLSSNVSGSCFVFKPKALNTDCTLPAQHQITLRQSYRLAGEHSGAFIS